MKQVSDKSDKMVLEIGSTIRIKKNNHIKKLFSRDYRTEKSMKEFEKAGYPAGSYELTVDEFLAILKDNITPHRKFVIKKATKNYEEGTESIEVGRNTKRDRRKIKAKLKKKFGDDISDKVLMKNKDNLKEILIVTKEDDQDSVDDLFDDDLF